MSKQIQQEKLELQIANRNDFASLRYNPTWPCSFASRICHGEALAIVYQADTDVRRRPSFCRSA